MITLICIMIIVFVCLGNVKFSVGKDKLTKPIPNKKLPKSQQGIGARMGKPQKEHKLCQAATVKSHKIGTLGLEDRENDWLAQQLREEAKLKKKIFSE